MKSLFALMTLAMAAASHALGFADITNWAGTGSNQAALVIDWNDGKSPESIVWGFRWNGTATGKDMLDAVLAADSRLFASVEYWPSYNGYTVFGLGYDVDGDGGGYHVGVREDDPNSDFPGSEDGYALDSDDHYREGWYTGYWSYFVAEGTDTLPSASGWNYSGYGLSARTLNDGSWDGWSYDDFNGGGGTPGTPSVAPVPEPASLASLVGLVLLAKRRKR